MFLESIRVESFKVLKNVEVDYVSNPKHRTFPLASINGGGKSTFLQLVFVMLHCPFFSEREGVVRNLLSRVNFPLEKKQLVTFKLIFEGQKVELEFVMFNNKKVNLDFDAILDLEEIDKKKRSNNLLKERILMLNELLDEIKNTGRVSTLVRRELRRFSKNGKEARTLDEQNNPSFFIEYITNLEGNLNKRIISDEELQSLKWDTEERINLLNGYLSQNNLKYVLHFCKNEKVLLYNSNVDIDTLKRISNNVFLAAPSSQVFHFLNDKINNDLFKIKKSDYLFGTYEGTLEKIKDVIPGFFTYEFASNELIKDSYKKARDEDFEQAMETGTYGNNLKETKSELNTFLPGKEITVNKSMSEVIFKDKITKKRLLPEDLSHGELKKLSIFIWLKRNAPKDSLVLMDEIDIGLHPRWQYEIADDLERWTKNNQFILATHSPQIISCSYYKNLVVLTKNKSGKSFAKQFNDAFLALDLNTVLKTIMETDYIPKEVSSLHKKYEAYVVEGKENTPEAIKIKNEILEHESENSSFFKDLEFFIKLKD